MRRGLARVGEDGQRSAGAGRWTRPPRVLAAQPPVSLSLSHSVLKSLFKLAGVLLSLYLYIEHITLSSCEALKRLNG